MAKVLKFDSPIPLRRKVKSDTNEPRGKLIEFPRQKLNLGNTEIEKASKTSTPAVFFGCF